MKALSKSDKLRYFIAPKMTHLIIFLDNNVKSSVYTRGYIPGIYHNLDMIGALTTFTTSGQHYHNFSPLSSINDDSETIQPVIVDVRKVQKSICGYFERIGHKSDA